MKLLLFKIIFCGLFVQLNKLLFNPLTFQTDYHLISPYIITAESNTEVTRIKKMITALRSSWLVDNDPPGQCQRKCTWNSMENTLTLYTRTSVSIFSSLFSIHFLWSGQGEFVWQSKHHRLGIIFFILTISMNGSAVIILRRIWMQVTLRI